MPAEKGGLIKNGMNECKRLRSADAGLARLCVEFCEAESAFISFKEVLFFLSNYSDSNQRRQFK